MINNTVSIGPSMSNLSDLISFVRDKNGYDLHSTDLGPISIDGWESYPVRHFRYSKIDPDGTKKTGAVALLDPEPEQIARWVYTAIVSVLGSYSREKAQQLVTHCQKQSGFQFVVRGVHWENMTPIYTAYTFYDGVTVRLVGWSPSWPTSPLSEYQLSAALGATWDDVAEARRYARIQGTTREEYLANGGIGMTEGKAWLSTVRNCYQAAWGADSNELMTAKARAMF